MSCPEEIGRLISRTSWIGLLDPGAPYALDLGMQPVIRPDDVQVQIDVGDGGIVDGMQVRDGIATTRFEQIAPRRWVVEPRL